jgi:hypothetical protein
MENEPPPLSNSHRLAVVPVLVQFFSQPDYQSPIQSPQHPGAIGVSWPVFM